MKEEIKKIFSEKNIDEYNYTKIIELFGNIILEKYEENYQGDAFILLENDNKIGYLQFGWGSCPGCDALQACDTIEDIYELYLDLNDGVKWFENKKECLEWFENHDFEGDYCWNIEEFREFYYEAMKILNK